jgi:hypothetical protein
MACTWRHKGRDAPFRREPFAAGIIGALSGAPGPAPAGVRRGHCGRVLVRRNFASSVTRSGGRGLENERTSKAPWKGCDRVRARRCSTSLSAAPDRRAPSRAAAFRRRSGTHESLNSKSEKGPLQLFPFQGRGRHVRTRAKPSGDGALQAGLERSRAAPRLSRAPSRTSQQAQRTSPVNHH